MEEPLDPLRGPEGVRSPAWLTEAALTALHWEHEEGADTPWGWWLHSIEGERPEGAIGWLEHWSEVSEEPSRLWRFSPDSAGPRQWFARTSAPAGARGLVALHRAHLLVLPEQRIPVLLAAGDEFPHESILSMPGAPEPVAVVVAFASDAEHAAVLVRPADMAAAERTGLVGPGAPAGIAIDVLGRWGMIGSAEVIELPLPWLRFALSGTSGVAESELPAGVELVIVSSWLWHLGDVVELGADENDWRAALERLWMLEVIQGWPDARNDQIHERLLGEWLAPDVALRVSDPALIGVELLASLPHPSVGLERLRGLGGDALAETAQQILTHHPRYNRWM